MLRPIDNYFWQQEEPVKTCLSFLREYILKFDLNIKEKWQYSMPFYYYRDKRICYLWVHKKTGQPYLGIADGKSSDHPDLLQEKRARMKILLIDPGKNVPVSTISKILKQIISFTNKKR